MPSYTYVMKAEKLLRSRNIKCRIVRNENTSTQGCGFSLEIEGGCSEAVGILKSNSIPVTGVS